MCKGEIVDILVDICMLKIVVPGRRKRAGKASGSVHKKGKQIMTLIETAMNFDFFFFVQKQRPF